MPVKVRCPECDHVLTLPDQARGKAAKCPECQARVPVPGGKKKAPPARATAGAKKKRPAAASRDETGEEVFANLDLSRVEDRQVRVCPKCGIQVDEEDIECPKCFVDLATGRLSAERQRKKERGGPDPDKFYEKSASTGWEFLKEHWKLGLRTMIYSMVALVVCLLASYMTIYTSKLPLKVFWGGIALLFALMAPGWCWHLHTLLINASIDKKVKLDRVHFDFFTSVALGIKFVSWLIVFCAPFQVVFGTVGGLMISNDMAAAGAAVIAVGFLPGFFCFPVAMAHMAMPVQWPGWLSPKILQQYFSGLVKPSMFWCMFCAATMLPTVILGLVAVLVFQEDINTFVANLNHNARVEHVMEYEEEKKKKDTPDATELEGKIETELNAFSWWFFASKEAILSEKRYYGGTDSPAPAGGDDKTPEWQKETDTESVIVPVILLVLACAPFGFAAVFNMKTNGLLTYYHRPELQLIAEEKETVWKPKSTNIDEEGNETADATKVVVKIVATIVFYVVANIVCYFTTDGKYLIMPRPLAQALNLVNSDSGSQ